MIKICFALIWKSIVIIKALIKKDIGHALNSKTDIISIQFTRKIVFTYFTFELINGYHLLSIKLLKIKFNFKFLLYFNSIYSNTFES
jgi:hypothetical protein